MKYCISCGKPIPETSKFCLECGATQPAPSPAPEPAEVFQAEPAQQAAPPAPEPMAPQVPSQAPPVAHVHPAPKKGKNRTGLFVAVGASVVLVAAIAIVLILYLGKGAPTEVTYSYLSRQPTPQIDYVVTDTVFPSLYRTMDALITFTATCEGGEKDVLIEVEVPGFTQKYQQKFTLGEQITKLNIRPPLLTGDLSLGTEKDAQLVLSVTEVDTGKKVVQDSRNIVIKSKYDVVWWTEEYGDMNNDNILAWMTPEAPGVLSLKRGAVDYLSFVTDGQLNSIVGYQNYGVFNDISMNTWVQAVALQGAMSDVVGVRYNNAAFSIGSDVQQRVMLPDDVLSSQSGICIETALVMASALQSAGMHPMLIFPPGHAQVAVECWPGTGEYFLIETTILPMPQTNDAFDYVVSYLTKDEWQGYIYGTGEYTLGECYVLDCDLGKKLGIVPMSN